ncbi:hypothetical protein F4861DRAFT_501166 [Xylaria intraflava]|nr:hypothetical protein F4861DRAFT_501166 [Xylaria intraflava]
MTPRRITLVRRKGGYHQSIRPDQNTKPYLSRHYTNPLNRLDTLLHITSESLNTANHHPPNHQRMQPPRNRPFKQSRPLIQPPPQNDFVNEPDEFPTPFLLNHKPTIQNATHSRPRPSLRRAQVEQYPLPLSIPAPNASSNNIDPANPVTGPKTARIQVMHRERVRMLSAARKTRHHSLHNISLRRPSEHPHRSTQISLQKSTFPKVVPRRSQSPTKAGKYRVQRHGLRNDTLPGKDVLLASSENSGRDSQQITNPLTISLTNQPGRVFSAAPFRTKPPSPRERIRRRETQGNRSPSRAPPEDIHSISSRDRNRDKSQPQHPTTRPRTRQARPQKRIKHAHSDEPLLS